MQFNTTLEALGLCSAVCSRDEQPNSTLPCKSYWKFLIFIPHLDPALAFCWTLVKNSVWPSVPKWRDGNRSIDWLMEWREEEPQNQEYSVSVGGSSALYCDETQLCKIFLCRKEQIGLWVTVKSFYILRATGLPHRSHDLTEGMWYRKCFISLLSFTHSPGAR